MRYIRGFQFSNETTPNPNTYPYNVFKNKTGELLVFDQGITLLYGENGSGKSTFLNLLANLLQLPGAEKVKSFDVHSDRWQDYQQEALLLYEEDAEGHRHKISPDSRYIKSEDILYEIKKVQQEAVLREGYRYERRRLGMTAEKAAEHLASFRGGLMMERLAFAQEKYSNGETSLQVFEDYLVPDSLILLDEPEISLSPENQLKLADKINQCAYRMNSQFVIATHSPLLLGKLEGTIYNFSKPSLVVARWQELPVVQLYGEFFQKRYRVDEE
ncbi:AAA family ATPase [Enterococcus sp. AD013-P3]|uniref:AAA family ATPase n=1 Tax=Enterococcus sp. AD013-P3 TaxID=3411036 RepID=UPI003B940AE3